MSSKQADSKRLDTLEQRCNQISSRVNTLSSEMAFLKINVANNMNNLCRRLNEADNQIHEILEKMKHLQTATGALERPPFLSGPPKKSR